MSSIFSEKDSNVRFLIPRFQGSLSLYYNNKTHRIGFLDREIYDAYPELRARGEGSEQTENPLSIKDLNKRKIYLVLKHAKWISPILLKGYDK
jgi:hypothetical protein